MLLKAIREALLRGEILYAESYGAGFPLWSPHGTEVAEQLVSLYLDVLGRHTNFVEFSPPMLFDPDDYRQAMNISYEYTNMFNVRLGDRMWLLKPDSLLAVARRARDEQCRMPVVVCSSLYRSETGSVTPLVRDKHMWSTVQVVHSVDERDVDNAYTMHSDVFMELLNRLCLAPLEVECPPLRLHSRRRRLVYLCPSATEITLCSTLYDISDALMRRLGTGGRLLDFGFTGKLIAVIAALFSDEKGLALPSSLAPTVVAVIPRDNDQTDVARRIVRELSDRGLRAALESGPWRGLVRKHKRRGTPVVLTVDAGGQVLMSVRSRHGITRPGDQIATAVEQGVRRHDHYLRKKAAEVLEKASQGKACLLTRGEEYPNDQWHCAGDLIRRGDGGPNQSRDHERQSLLIRERRLY